MKRVATRWVRAWSWVWLVPALLSGCTAADARTGRVRRDPVLAASSPAIGPAPGGPAPASSLPPVRAAYPWSPAPSSERLDARFRSPPAGFARVEVEPGSFGEFLRSLPLLARGAPVVDFRGHLLHDRGRHPNIAAVVDVDIGARDLQHCADAIIRLNAEWRYGRGDREIAYRSVSGQSLSYARYVAGERAVADGQRLAFRRAAPARGDDHGLFREWLDDVFAWAGTASLERDARKVASRADLRPGDFFVMSGAPYGHAVLVVDVAKDDRGRIALLVGQSYMPAQSFQILRPAPRGSASSGAEPDDGSDVWFVVEATDDVVETPFWRPFPLGSLRRF